MRIRLTTYNILHGYHSDLIIKNISFLIEKGVNVICLQEVKQEFKKSLENLLKTQNWKGVYLHYPRACNLAIIWNPLCLTLENEKHILLPILLKPSFLQQFTGYAKEKLQRGALSACFSIGNKIFRITNAHLAWEGGARHRLSQLGCIMDILDKELVDYDVLAGDFNTPSPVLFRRIQEKKIENKLGKKWTNVFQNIPYTCDTSYFAPQDGLGKYIKILHLFGIKFKQRLDYIFIKNLKIISKEMFDLLGSDHRPLMASFIDDNHQKDYLL